MKRVLLVLFTLAWSVSGHASTLFGVALGQLLQVPECTQRQLPLARLTDHRDRGDGLQLPCP
ncbi:MAG: hypothetical protein EPN74_07595 [Rhodanobacter sp.]|nr:MAG: hypothetical protein EPN74_07595 [Rhodanobacter sp.]